MYGKDNDIIQPLIHGGADPNKANNSGQSPLHLANANGHSDVMKVLLKGGANPNKADSRGKTPLYYGRSHPGTVKLLLNSGANPDIMNNGGPLIQGLPDLSRLVLTSYNLNTDM